MTANSMGSDLTVWPQREGYDAVVLGAGIVGISTAYWLNRAGLSVAVIERRSGAAQETSFANGGQISVSHAEPWANPGAPLKVLKWLTDKRSPLLFRPKLDPHQFAWLTRFLVECLPSRSTQNTKDIVELALFSRRMLQHMRADEGIAYDERTEGILHFYRNRQEFEAAKPVAEMMQTIGCDREILTREDVFKIEPTLAEHGQDIVGGTFTQSDESGDVHLYTKRLAEIAERQGVTFLYDTQIDALAIEGGGVTGVHVRDRTKGDAPRLIATKAAVVSMGAYTAPFLRQYGLNLPIYPAKGYSITVPVGAGDMAPTVSLTDDEYKLVYSRLGDRLRVAGSAELVGYDTTIDPVRCDAIFEQVAKLFPKAGDYSEATFWTGLRPATPSNLPILGQRGAKGLFLNAGHGTLGWTMGPGSGFLVGREVAQALGARKASELNAITNGNDSLPNVGLAA